METGDLTCLGQITKAAQPAFAATLSARQTNVATDSYTTIQFNTEGFDIGGNFDTASYTFTAPTSGIYQFVLHAGLAQLDTGSPYYAIGIVHSGTAYTATIDSSVDYTADLDAAHYEVNCLIQMAANDTTYCRIYAPPGGAAQADILETMANSWFAGHLVA